MIFLFFFYFFFFCISLTMQRLWFKTNLKLCKIYFDIGEYGRMNKVICLFACNLLFNLIRVPSYVFISI